MTAALDSLGVAITFALAARTVREAADAVLAEEIRHAWARR